jgi:hypothetical protein
VCVYVACVLASATRCVHQSKSEKKEENRLQGDIACEVSRLVLLSPPAVSIRKVLV